MTLPFALKIRPTFILLFTLLGLCIAQPGVSQSLESIGKERQGIDATLAQHEERVRYLVDRIERTQEELDEATKELTEQESNLTQAIATAEAEPGDASARAATLASIRYNRAEAKLERLQERLDSAQGELDSIKDHQTELKQRLLVLNAQAEKAKAAAAAAAKAAETAAKQPAPQPVAPAIAAPTVAAPVVPAEPVSWPTPQDENAASIAFAKQTLARLSSSPVGDAPLNNVKLNHNRGRGTETFRYLGDNLYRVDMKLEAGMWGFKIYNQTFWMSVPKEMADQDFVLIYDVSSKAALHVFRAKLIN